MAKVAFEDKLIEVTVRGIRYTFTPVDNLSDVEVDKLVVLRFSKRDRVCTHVWECKAEIDYDVQGHMENILVSDRHRWFDKNYAMTRLTSYDEQSFSFTGPDKKSVHLVKMGTKYYVTKLN